MNKVEKALALAATKPCPQRFSISDGTADYYHVEIITEEGEFLALPEEMTDHQLLPVRLLSDNRYIDHPSMNVGDIEASSVRVTHFYRTTRFTYQSATSFILAHYCKWTQLNSVINRWTERGWQNIFNKRNLIIKDRIEVLDSVLTIYFNGTNEFTTDRLITLIHSTERWYLHPDSDETRRRYRLILQSLAAEGCLREEGGSFTILPEALTVLEQVQREERRHSDLRRLSFMLVVLTSLLVITGAFQAGAAMFIK